MTAVSLVWGPLASPHALGATSASSSSLNDADNSLGTVFTVPKDGIITKIGIPVLAITGNPPGYNIGLVDVTAATGAPGTTAQDGSTNTVYDFTATGLIWVTLTTPATVTAGTIRAARIWPTGTAPDGSNYISVVYPILTTGGSRLPHTEVFAATWTASMGPVIAVMYNDGTVALPGIISNTTGVFGSDHTPDEIGALFQLPADAICNGALFNILASSTASDFTVKLYAADNTLLASQDIDTSQMDTAVATYSFKIGWDPVVLLANTNYRLTLLPTTTNHITLAQATVNEAESRYYWPEGQRWQGTSRTNAGAWTDNPLVLPMLALLLSDITFSTTPAPTTTTIFGIPAIPVTGLK